MRSKTLVNLLMCGLLAASAQAQTFQGIGIVTGAATSEVQGISGDGTTLVVRDGANASLWRNGVRTDLGPMTYADEATFDGAIAAGGINFNQAARWDGAWQPMGYLATPGSVPFAASLALGISADGDEMVGFSTNSAGVAEAFYWTTASGTMQGMGHLGATPLFSSARAISANGQIAVGDSEYEPGRYEAFRWTPSGTLQGLGFLSPDKSSRAHGISADGSIIVGWSGTTTSPRAAMWPNGGGPVALGPSSIAFDASATGDVIVGGDPMATTSNAWVWTAAAGAQDLQSLLAAAGAASWELLAATAISDDGCTVGGIGLNPAGVREGFVATLGGCGDLRIEKRVLLPSGAKVRRFGVVTYHIQVASSGGGTVIDFVVEDILPTGLNLLASTTDNGAFDPVAGQWQGTDPLAPGEVATLLLQVEADDPILEPSVENCAAVLRINGVSINPSLPGYESCVKFNYKHASPRKIDMLTTKEGKLFTSSGLQQIVYAIKVGNNGPSTSHVMLADLPRQSSVLQFMGALGTAGAYNPALGIWDVGPVSKGQSELLELTFSVNPGFSGVIENTVFTSAPDTETFNPDNAVTFSITVP